LSGGWARYALERYSLLKRWRELAELVARACRETLSSRCMRVLVVGGAAEGRLTVLSDIDIVIVVPNPSLKNIDTKLAIRRRAEELGLPLEAPIDLKILTEPELEELKRRGLYREVVDVTPQASSD